MTKFGEFILLKFCQIIVRSHILDFSAVFSNETLHFSTYVSTVLTGELLQMLNQCSSSQTSYISDNKFCLIKEMYWDTAFPVFLSLFLICIQIGLD